MSLAFVSVNAEAADTILLLHGLTSSHREWEPVAAALAHPTDPQHHAYHLLIPDLPGHTGSSAIRPLTLSSSIALLCDLIASHAHGGTCHVVGFSLGGYVALGLAEQHRELTRSVFVSGVYNMAQSRYGPLLKFAPYADVFLTGLQRFLPQACFDWVVKGQLGLTHFPPGLQGDRASNSSVALVREGFAVIIEFGAGKAIASRVCLVAAGKHDDVEGVKELGKTVQGSQSEAKSDERVRAFVFQDAVHGWLLQHPSVFADAVRAWIVEDALPVQLEALL